MSWKLETTFRPQNRSDSDSASSSQSFSEFYPNWEFFPLQGPPFIEGFRLEMAANAGRDPRIYGDEQKRMRFLAQLQRLNCRQNRGEQGNWRSAEVEPAGILPVFQEEVSEVQAISPTVRRTVPAEITPSNLLAAAEGAYSAGSQTYRGLEPTPVQTMPPTPVRLPMFQHPVGKGWGSEVVGTHRKRLRMGNRTGPCGETRSNIPLSPVVYNPLRVRQKTLTGSESVRDASGQQTWIERMEAACDPCVAYKNRSIDQTGDQQRPIAANESQGSI